MAGNRQILGEGGSQLAGGSSRATGQNKPLGGVGISPSPFPQGAERAPRGLLCSSRCWQLLHHHSSIFLSHCHPGGKAGLPSAPRVWLSAPPPGSRCASRLPSWPRVLPALPYPPASSARVRFSELDSLMPRHELVVPRCSHTPHDSQKAACQGHVASYPKPASYVMGAWRAPSKRESVGPA